MRPDIVNLRQFYSSRLGRKVKRRLRRVLRDHWKDEAGIVTVGLGYTTPLLPLPDAKDNAARIVALMPVVQGAIYWPVDDANHSVLADEMLPPFMPSSVHRVLIAHAFEHTPVPDELLRVWWQLLAPGGRVLLMVPNRRGLWARFGQTPFATGTPYTLGNLRQLLNNAGFTVRDMRSALFTPPSTHPFWLNLFNVLEWLGAITFPRIGGVFVIEAEKQIYAAVREAHVAPKAKQQWVGATAMSSPINQPKKGHSS
jgi:SAM-dependent methyltransferase